MLTHLDLQLLMVHDLMVVLHNEKISRSAAIGWIALVGLSIRCAERELGDVPQDTTLYDRNTSIFLWTD